MEEMFILQLAYFVTLSKERHFARPADASPITQPTLAAAIRKLEEGLGVPLVARGHRFTGLTPEGEKLLAWSRQILTDYQSLINDLAGARTGLVGELRFGVIPAAMRSEEHTSELQSLMRISYAVFCLKKKI